MPINRVPPPLPIDFPKLPNLTRNHLKLKDIGTIAFPLPHLPARRNPAKCWVKIIREWKNRVWEVAIATDQPSNRQTQPANRRLKLTGGDWLYFFVLPIGGKVLRFRYEFEAKKPADHWPVP
jgi:hypothetical protein